MEKVKLGCSEMRVSRMTLGCWTFGSSSGSYWGAQEAAESEALLTRPLSTTTARRKKRSERPAATGCARK